MHTKRYFMATTKTDYDVTSTSVSILTSSMDTWFLVNAVFGHRLKGREPLCKQVVVVALHLKSEDNLACRRLNSRSELTLEVNANSHEWTLVQHKWCCCSGLNISLVLGSQSISNILWISCYSGYFVQIGNKTFFQTAGLWSSADHRAWFVYVWVLSFVTNYF